MQVWKDRGHHELETPCLQKNGAPNNFPTQMSVRSARSDVESRKPAECILYSPGPQELVCAIPKSGECKAQAVFREDKQIKVENRFRFGGQDVSATHFVLFIDPKTEPDVSDELPIL